MSHIIEATALSRPYYGAGHVVYAIALEYDIPVAEDSVKASAFAVKDRNITGVYCADSPMGEAAPAGKFVIINLCETDPEAMTVKRLNPNPPRPQAEADGEHRRPMGPPKHMSRFGVERIGPFGKARKRKKIQVPVSQVSDIMASDGTIIPAGEEIITGREINALSDKFIQLRYGEYEYNLYVPENAVPGEKYPMVTFIGDASITGSDARITLEQGNGALVWVTDEEQAKHPCFVLAPVVDDDEPITDDNYFATPMLDTIKEMVDDICANYSVDKKRVYTTGQSMGCMSSFELMYRYPETFAAALCVSGHWTRQKIADCAARGQNMWVVLSEEDDKGFPCIQETMALMDAAGTKYGYYEWDGSIAPEEISKLAKAAAEDGNSFRISVYPGDSALRIGQPDECAGGHPAGWHLSYRVEALRDWLFTCSL